MTEIGILGEREDRMKRSAENRRRFNEIVKRLEAEVAAETAREKLEARLKPKAAEPAEDAKPFAASCSGYAIMDRANTYAFGVHALREACKSDSNCIHPTFAKKDSSSIYRPLTFEETIRARLEDYNTLENPSGSKRGDEERKRLFRTWLDSCTGIAYKKGSTLFKIIAQSEGLIGIPKNFSGHYIQANYSHLQGAELDSSQGKYNQTLTLDEVLEHPAWNAAVADRQLLKDYAELVFRMKEGNNMAFLVRRNTSQDELRAQFVDNIGDNSNASGNNYLNINGCFVRVTHRAP